MSSVQQVYTAELVQFLNVYMAASRQRIQSLEDERDALEVRSAIYTDLKTKLQSLRSLANRRLTCSTS